MLIKPKVMPADPTRVCKTCSHHDPDLHVCCANDYAIRDEEANTMSCSDWNPKKICITCGYFDPDTNQCWFEEHDMSEEESLTRTCESWEPRKEKLNVFNVGETIGMDRVNPVEVPLQPDGSLKMQAKETIGASVVNPDGVTKLTFGGTSLQELAAKQKKQEEQLPPGACCFNCEHRDKMSLNCKLKLSDAVLTVERSQHEYCDSWEREQDHGVTLRVVDPEEDKKQKSTGWDHRLEAKALDRGARQGMTLEALDTVFAIACQQVPSMEKRWMELKGEINAMFAKKWAAEDMPE